MNTAQRVAASLLISILSAAGSAAQAPGPPPIPPISDIHQGFIYQIVTDRFFNGDPGNDDPPQSKGEFDAKGFSNPTIWRDYWGGDLAGITQKLAYLKSMGVAAI